MRDGSSCPSRSVVSDLKSQIQESAARASWRFRAAWWRGGSPEQPRLGLSQTPSAAGRETRRAGSGVVVLELAHPSLNHQVGTYGLDGDVGHLKRLQEFAPVRPCHGAERVGTAEDLRTHEDHHPVNQSFGKE